jgi:hypothetical protein
MTGFVPYVVLPSHYSLRKVVDIKNPEFAVNGFAEKSILTWRSLTINAVK